MPINDNGPNLNALVTRTKPQTTFWIGLINETTEAIRLEQELRKLRKKGSEDDLTKFYALRKLQDKLCESLNQMSPPETKRNDLKQIDERELSISIYADTVTKWVEDMKPLIPQYMLRDPVDDLSARVQRLSEQHKKLEKKRPGIQKREIPVIEELEEGEIRESPSVEVNPSEEGEIRKSPSAEVNPYELLERTKQFHTSRKVIARYPEDISASISSVLTSEAVKHIIEDETTGVLNAGISRLMVTVGNLEDTCIIKAYDMLEDILKIIETINDRVEHTGAHAHMNHHTVVAL